MLRNLKSADRERLAEAGLEGFFAITREWTLNNSQARKLLGDPPESTFFKMKRGDVKKLPKDTLERISYLLGIYKNLHVLLPDAARANEWIHRPNDAPLFGGAPALDKLLRGRVVDLYEVRRYLDGERGW